MPNIDFTQVITADARAAEQLAERLKLVKVACTRRITQVLDANTVSNIQGAVLAGVLTEDELAVFRAGHGWVRAMQVTCRDMPAETDYTADDAWPDLPEGVAELAALY